MTTIRCSFTLQPHHSFDLAHLLSTPDAVLSDEHPQSSYGLPVLVEDGGRVYGSGDLTPETHLAVMLQPGEAIPDLLARAKLAGYHIRILRADEPLSHAGTLL